MTVTLLFQGASASFPAFYCNVSQEMLKKHGAAEEEHNFTNSTCQPREFEKLRKHLDDQISDIQDLDPEVRESEQFFKYVIDNDVNSLERKFRDRGKHHCSVIGKNNSPCDSIQFCLGGSLHNEIGLGEPSKLKAEYLKKCFQVELKIFTILNFRKPSYPQITNK